jgi:hypothetical protein
MDEKAFKKHLHDLVHGHHHPEEHDWEAPKRTVRKRAAPAKTDARKGKRRAK